MEHGRFERLFTNIEVIGRGSFGNVFKSMKRDENKIYAIK